MKRFLKCFVYAFKGICHCICSERNMRIHLCFSVYMFSFLTLFDFFEVSRTQYAVLITLCALVMSLEAVNTAVEKAVDLVTGEKNELARIAKDSSAGAVLISAIASVAAGIAIMWQPDAFREMFAYYSQNIPVLLGLIASIILSLVFVFAGPSKIKDFFIRGKK